MLLKKSVLSKVLSFSLSFFIVLSMMTQTTLAAYQAELDGMPLTDDSLPTFIGAGAVGEPVGYTTNSMMKEIYEAEKDGTSFWMDRMLARPGNDPSTADNQGNMLSKGRSIWMGWHDPSKLGFAGEVAYIDESDRDQSLSKTDGVSGYIIDLTSSGLTENVSKRVSYPSYWTSEYNDVNGLNVNIKKFFTENNVAVSVLDIKNNSSAAKNITMTVTSPRAKNPSGDELTGEYSAPRGLTKIYPRISGDGLTASGTSLTGTFSVAAGQTVSKKVIMGFITDEIPESTTDYNRFKGYDPETAFVTQVREYNQWWADNIPYIDVPDKNIKKMIYYRWWLDRFNLQDNELSISKGYAFPTSVEGVTGYNNAITLPLPWMLEESRYLRNPDLNYGTWLSMGATSGGGAFKDNPGNAPFWNYGPGTEMKSFVQYITKAGWDSYKVYGGQDALLSKFADYGYNDVKDFMAKYDKNNDGIITLPDGSWTGFDSDSPVTKYYNNSGGTGGTGGPVDSLSSAYVYANAQAVSEMYSKLGNTEKANEMSVLADKIKYAVLTKMWDSNKKEFLNKDVNSSELNPWKDIINFYPYTMGLVPTDDPDYREMFKLWTNPNDFVVWPALIGDIQDSHAAEASGKSMTYNSAPSSMGVSLSFLAKAVKDYPSDYITADVYKQLLYWGAWGMYVGGNTDYPDANEFWSNVDNSSIGYRSWIHHNMHSKYNVSIIEDVAGFTPRLDNKIELNPIDIGWGHFTVNNLRYHGSDLTIIWNGDNHYDGIPEGYSVYIDGTRSFTVDSLKHLVWDSLTGEVTFPDGDSANVSYNVSDPSFQSADGVSYSGDRVAEMFKKVGLNIAGTAAVTGVSVAPSEMSLYKNQTKQLTAAVEPQDAQNIAVKWQSSNPDIASVDEYGNVTGVSEGQTTITATTEDGGFKASCTVTVSQANAGDLAVLKLDKSDMSLFTNDTGKLTASVQGTFNELTNIALNTRGTGYPAPSASYTNSSDNIWYAVDGSDSTDKRWTSWNSKNTSDWFQIDFGASESVNRLGLNFYNDGGGVVPPTSYKVQYWNGTEFSDVQNMKQSPVTPTGTSENVVYFDDVSTQKIKVIMTNKNPANMGSFVGINEIGVFYDPYYSQTLNWTSSNPAVATVDQSGNISALSPGTTTITVKTSDDKLQDECVVTVNAVNKSLLAQKISYVQHGLSEEDFTQASWTALQSSLSIAVNINDKSDATQTEVDAALKGLMASINGLKYEADHSIIDFSSNGTGTLDFGGGDQVKRFQTFVARPGYSVLKGVDVKILDNNATGDATFELYNADSNGMPMGSALASATVSKAAVDSSISQNNGIVHAGLNFDGLTAGQQYIIALGQTTASDTDHDYKWYSSADTSNPDWWRESVTNPQVRQDGLDVPSGKYDGTNWADESRLGDYWLKVYTQTVDKTVLVQKISDAQGLAEADYTPDSWIGLQSVLSSAVEINNRIDATQGEVDSAVDQLNAAISGLVMVDHSIIDFSSNGTGTLDFGAGDQAKRFQTFIARSGYTDITGIDVKITDNGAKSDATFELYNADSNGMPTGSALASETVSRADVDSSISQNNGIVHVALHYSGLIEGNKYAIALGQATVSSVNNSNDYKWYSSADTNIPNWWSEGVTNPQIQQDGQDVPSGKYSGTNWVDESRLGDYWLKIYTAEAVPVDKAALTQKISYAQSLSEENFTQDSWAALQSSLGSAVGVNEKPEATQTEVDAALNSLIESISGLRYKADHSIIDFSSKGTGTLDFGGGDQVKRFQTFVARPGYVNITGIDVKIVDNNAESDAIFELYNADSNGMPMGSALASATVSKADVDSSISQNNGIVHLTFTYNGLIAGNKYALALGQATASDVNHDYKWYSSADTSNPDWWKESVTNPQIQQDGQDVPSGKYDGTDWADESRLGDYWLKVYTGKAIPTIPTELTATAAGSSTINLSWTPVPEATGYNVYRASEEDGTYAKVAEIPINSQINGIQDSSEDGASYLSVDTTTNSAIDFTPYLTVDTTTASGINGSAYSVTYADTGLQSGTTYYYKVTAVTEAGESYKSEVAYATTVPLAVVPEIPANLTARAAGTTSINLTWTPVIGATGYNVYMAATPGGTYTRLTDGTILTNSYISTGLSAATTYFYKVTAVNAAGESDKSEVAYATTTSLEVAPAVPTNLIAKAAGTSSINLTWTPVPGAIGYNVYMATTLEGTYTKLTDNAVTTNSYCSTGLSAATTYFYKVTAVNAVGESEISDAVYAATLANNASPSTSSGGSSSTPAPTPTVPASVVSTEKNGTSVVGKTTTEAKIDSNGNAAAAVTKSQITEAVTKAAAEAAKSAPGTAAIVEIKVNAKSDAKSVETSIPVAAINTINDNKIDELIISTPIAEITLDQKTLSGISKETGTDVKITVSKVDAATLSGKVKKTVGDAPVYDLSVKIDNRTISEFGGNVQIEIPYTLKLGEDKNAIVIYSINAEGKAEIVGNCAYDIKTQRITFSTDHSSQYVLGYNKVTFKDVAANAWYGDAVTFLAARDITTGTGDGNFGPADKLTRGQFLVMLMKAYGQKPDENSKDNFVDAGNTYYTGYLAAAKRLGITDGVGDNKYAPNKEITRQEMVALLYNALKLMGEQPAGKEGKALTDFSDAGSIAPWAKEAMTVFVEAGIVGGSDNMLTPKATTNRAQMAQILYNLLSK